MPTCDAPGPLASKKTRSPAWTAARSTCTPALACSKLVRGSVTPAWANAHWVRPEQSHEFGPTPPSAYGRPIFERAARDRGASAAPDRRRGALDAERAERLPARRRRRPRARARDWNARTAPRVWRPNTPSALMPSARWTAIVVAAGSRWSIAPPAAAAAERAARDRPDDTVDLEPVRGLERAHRAPRLAPEHAVGGDPRACAGPRPPPGRALPMRRSSPAAVPATSVPWARAASLAGASTVAVISAAETSACFLR